MRDFQFDCEWIFFGKTESAKKAHRKGICSGEKEIVRGQNASNGKSQKAKSWMLKTPRKRKGSKPYGRARIDGAVSLVVQVPSA